MAQLFDAVPADDLPDVPNYNLCPTTPVHVLRSEGGQRLLQPIRRGFLPHWYKFPTDRPLPMNARAETIAEKPAFRAACRDRRCLIPATGFFGWTKDEDGKRLPWYIFRADREPLAFAGIWQDWEGEALRTCVIVTTGANDRMPVILPPEDWPLWLGEGGKGAAALMTAASDDVLDFCRVDPAVNSNRTRGEGLIAPI